MCFCDVAQPKRDLGDYGWGLHGGYLVIHQRVGVLFEDSTASGRSFFVKSQQEFDAKFFLGIGSVCGGIFGGKTAHTFGSFEPFWIITAGCVAVAFFILAQPPSDKAPSRTCSAR